MQEKGQHKRDHGGGLDSAAQRYGGNRKDWVDLSTGINPRPYPVPDCPPHAWAALPDEDAQNALISAAKSFWNVPDGAMILPTHGASASIAQIPSVLKGSEVSIPGPTYNEHAAAFSNFNWRINQVEKPIAKVLVSPNNPDGIIWDRSALDTPYCIVDESFCDVAPGKSMITETGRPGVLILKSFGKFWGLAGLRLGFVIGDPTLVEPLAERLGPWSVSGPALHIGTLALRDETWAKETRLRLKQDAERLDTLLTSTHAELVGGTSLFRLYDVGNAAAFQDRLARHRILSRIFPYNNSWIRLGLPHPDQWDRIEAALE